MGLGPPRRPLHDPAAGSRCPSVDTTASAPAGDLPRWPLHDVAQYSEADLPRAAVTTTTTTLAELARLVRAQTYHDRRRAETRLRLHRCLVASALAARLARAGDLAHRTLVDKFRSDDKKGFAVLYNAIHDVRSSCDATRRYASLEPDLDRATPAKNAHAEASPVLSTFMDRLPQQTQADFVDLVSRLRTDPDFLAGRLCSLSTSELASLTAFHQSLDPVDSVMPSHPRGRPSGPPLHRSTTHSLTPVERLLSFHRRDPLCTLLYTVFAATAAPDAAEDRRRTDIWSTACARMIADASPGGEQFLRVVLNAWAAMWPWPAKSRLELYLMKALQDGAFLLDKVDDGAPRTQVSSEARPPKDAIAAEEFFDAAVRQLFQVLDDESAAGGLPTGVVELGRAILQKLDEPGKQRAAQTFIVSKWFFSHFLLNALIYPESHGMMSGHHITEYARQRIFKEIASQASKYVLDTTFNWKQSVPVLPEIRSHIDHILARFHPSRRSRVPPVLVPVASTTSPPAMVEVEPFLMVCPADLQTIVNALFPERRPPSGSLEKDLHHRGLRSAASSVSIASALSTPFRVHTPSLGGVDAGSMLSTSGSSMMSDATSREPLLDMLGQSTDGRSSYTSFGSRETLQNYQKPSTMEEYGQRLRVALDEMVQHLGPVAVAGSSHPCAEDWTILYVSSDGDSLATRTHQDWDRDDEDDSSFPDSESDGDAPLDAVDLEREYHQLKDVIIRLLQKYELPEKSAPGHRSTRSRGRALTFDDRPDTDGASAGLRADPSGEGLSKNPYQSQRHLSGMIATQKDGASERRRSQRARDRGEHARSSRHDAPSLLVTMLDAATHQCHANGDFLAAHLYAKTLEQMRRLSSSSLSRNGYAPLLHYFARGPRETLIKSERAMEEMEAWFGWVEQAFARQAQGLDQLMRRVTELRDKMWYVTDVKNSAAYEEARNVAIALKTMGQVPRAGQGRRAATSRSRSMGKATTSNFLLKTEIQMVDLMTAPAEQGGPYKLSDEQSEMTTRWLTQYGVENFCKGEERIHRFCLEIDKCVNKLVGDDILEGPVLWSSDLFWRDKQALDRGHHKGDLLVSGMGTMSVVGDERLDPHSPRVGPRGLDLLGRSGPRDLRSFSARLASQSGLDVGKGMVGRGGSAVDLMDSQDYAGMAHHGAGPDAKTTFWSPFLAQAAPPGSPSSIRSRTASPAHDAVTLKHAGSMKEEKRRFLLDLKQTLIGLLLSDIGSLVWSHGCETDAWFSGELGEECIQRKLEKEIRRSKRALARRRSTKSLRSVKGESMASLEHTADDLPTSRDRSTDGSERAAVPSAGRAAFPYREAYVRILQKFSTHPNPFAKLHALYELELLIVASQAAGNGRSCGLASMLPTLGSLSELSTREAEVQRARARTLEETIANVESRRSHTIAASRPLTALPRSSGLSSPTEGLGTDAVVEVMRGLFCDAQIRPKALFRDLQFIASFVPFPILDQTACGKAFWDAGLAALGLKQDVCRTMIEIADDIVAYHTKHRSLSPTRRAMADEQSSELARFSMEDAAGMWSITAKEGDAVAQRELAIFYLTHPDLLVRTTLPLSKPRDTFKAQVMSQRNEDPVRSDPATMCVAYHWMELSSLGGDDLARKYLRAREELNALP
ncbi:MAG: hypothetical protein M1838_001357 [Thelocarpon superellum]|nr:MAG: hypothetical protein M1838_001357 [Thelocarpon superellum]